MGSNGGENTAILGNDEGRCSETTVEIKIKTLDSQTYTMRVDKCVPVPALKEQIATVTGVVVEQQRLICRGKVLKDDQLLSAYHVEDGHTLHMVVRQPIVPSNENTSNNSESDPASSSGNRMGTGVLVGSFNISEQGDGMPDLGRIVSAVLSSLTGGGTGGDEINQINLNELVRERASANAQQAEQTGTRDQSPGVALESLQPPVIPDSLTTLPQYLTHLRQEFDTTVRGLNNISQVTEPPSGVDGQDILAGSSASGPAGLPTPASLAEVAMSTRQMLIQQTAECLYILARQIENQGNMSDISERTRLQTHALRSGALLQNLGALLLELGRTMMTLRMGHTSEEAVVNAGPAIFVSPTGPNPIMVQPYQAGTGFGAIPVGSVQTNSGGSISSGFIPRNIDIRIRTARDRNRGASPTNNSNSSGTTTEGGGGGGGGSGPAPGPALRERAVRVIPLRSLLSSAAAAGSNPIGNAAASSDSTSGRSLGILFPVMTRYHHVTRRPSDHTNVDNNNNNNNGRTNSTPTPTDTVHVTGPDFSAEIQDGLNQLLRNFIGGENIETQNMDTSEGPAEVPVVAAVTQDATNVSPAAVSEEGLMLSNILREIIPIVSERIGTSSDTTAQAPPNPELGHPSRRRSSRQRRDPLPQTSPSKRQKKE